MAEMMYLVRYYCSGEYYREKVPEYDLKWMKSGLSRQKNCVLISVTRLGIDPNVEKPSYFNCVPYTAPGQNAVVDDPAERTRIEQLREKNPEELADFLITFLGQLGSSTNTRHRTQLVKWLLSTGPLRVRL